MNETQNDRCLDAIRVFATKWARKKENVDRVSVDHNTTLKFINECVTWLHKKYGYCVTDSKLEEILDSDKTLDKAIQQLHGIRIRTKNGRKPGTPPLEVTEQHDYAYDEAYDPSGFTNDPESQDHAIYEEDRYEYSEDERQYQEYLDSHNDTSPLISNTIISFQAGLRRLIEKEVYVPVQIIRKDGTSMQEYRVYVTLQYQSEELFDNVIHELLSIYESVPKQNFEHPLLYNAYVQSHEPSPTCMCTVVFRYLVPPTLASLSVYENTPSL